VIFYTPVEAHMLHPHHLVILLVASLPFGAFADAPATTQATRALDFPSFGVRVVPPPGWRRATADETGPDLSATVVTLVRADQPADQPANEELSIELGAKIGSTDAPTLAAWIDSLAKLHSMKVEADKTRLGPREATDLTAAPPQDGKPILIRGRVAVHAGYGCCLWLFSANPKPDVDAFERVAAQITFSDPKAPVEALSNSDRAFSPPGCPFVFSLPDPFRLLDGNDQQTQFRFNTFDFRSDEDESQLVIELPDSKNLSPDELRNRVGDNVKQDVGVAPTWKTATTAAAGITISYTDPNDLPPNGERAQRQLQAVIARGDDGVSIVMTFVYPKTASEAYRKVVVERVIPGIRKAK
jgi:hypothetical protein